MADSDATVIELLRQQSETLSDLKRSQTKQTEDLHALRVEQAGMAGRMDAMTSIPTRVANLETKLAGHHETLNHHSGLHNGHMELLTALRSEADRRQGLSGPLTKIAVGTVTALLVLILGAVLALVGLRSAKASTPSTDPRLSAAANAKCMAVPAKPRPRHLYL